MGVEIVDVGKLRASICDGLAHCLDRPVAGGVRIGDAIAAQRVAVSCQLGVDSRLDDRVRERFPARLGADRAAKVACGVMLAPQVIVFALLALGGHPVAALLVTGVAAAQVPLMRRLLQRPRELAPWYNQTGISLYVSGMMITAVALGSAR